MKLQLALDGTWSNSLRVLDAAISYIDIVEIGTPLIYREGMAAARELRDAFPGAVILADLKIMDAGEAEAEIAFTAGCDMVTVLGAAHDITVRGAVTAARSYGKRVVADMIQVPDPITRARQLLDIGCDYLCVHTAHDLKGEYSRSLAVVQRLQESLPDAPLAVAGGIGPATISAVAALAPEIVVIGSAITAATDPASTAKEIRRGLDAYVHLA
jgi:3-hexulose-6-phosphate synthase